MRRSYALLLPACASTAYSAVDIDVACLDGVGDSAGLINAISLANAQLLTPALSSSGFAYDWMWRKASACGVSSGNEAN